MIVCHLILSIPLFYPILPSNLYLLCPILSDFSLSHPLWLTVCIQLFISFPEKFIYCLSRNFRSKFLATCYLRIFAFGDILETETKVNCQWRSQGGEHAERSPPPRNRKNCCRKMMLFAKALFLATNFTKLAKNSIFYWIFIKNFQTFSKIPNNLYFSSKRAKNQRRFFKI